MSFVVQRGVRGRENRSVGNPAGRENMGSAAKPPVQPLEAPYLGATVSVTISRTNDVATGSATAHGLAIGDVVRILGSNQAEYNGDKRVDTVADANTFTFASYGSPTSPATGTMTCQKVIGGKR